MKAKSNLFVKDWATFSKKHLGIILKKKNWGAPLCQDDYPGIIPLAVESQWTTWSPLSFQKPVGRCGWVGAGGKEGYFEREGSTKRFQGWPLYHCIIQIKARAPLKKVQKRPKRPREAHCIIQICSSKPIESHFCCKRRHLFVIN